MKSATNIVEPDKNEDFDVDEDKNMNKKRG